MKTQFAITCVLFGMLLGPVAALAGADSDSDAKSSSDSDAGRKHPVGWVKDSVITTKIKTRLAAEHITSLGRIHVDTDNNGVVWLSGSARTKEAAEKAVAIAAGTEGVKSVKSEIRIKKDD